MLVVADSSPLIVLANIGHLEILPHLFGSVIIPPQVSAELQNPKRPANVRAMALTPPAWLTIQSPAALETIPALHAGELAAISLAQELHADLLLIDEMTGRKAATERGIRITGTIGVLELAADVGLLDLRSAFDLVAATDFWISRELLEERLRLFLARRGEGGKS